MYSFIFVLDQIHKNEQTFYLPDACVNNSHQCLQ